MSAQGTDSGTAWAESIPALACKADSLAATSRSNHPSLEFVGRMKTFHTCIDIPGCTAMVCLILLGLLPLLTQVNAKKGAGNRCQASHYCVVP